MLHTNLEHLMTVDDHKKFVEENENVMICCGRMGPMCIPVYGAMEELEDEYSNIKFADFVADELAATIDNQFKTSTNADSRGILGASYGGWNSGYFGLVRSDKFHLIGIHSPSTSNEIIQGYKDSNGLPIKVFMSTGVFNDTEVQARVMKNIIESSGYPLMYIEVNQGQSWGNWRGNLKPLLEYFFPPGN